MFLYRHLVLEITSNSLEGGLMKKMDETLPGTIVRSVGRRISCRTPRSQGRFKEHKPGYFVQGSS